MPKVSEIRVFEFSFQDAYRRWQTKAPPAQYGESEWEQKLLKQEAALRQCFDMLTPEFLEEHKASLPELLPRNPQHRVDFKLSETFVEVANAIRRAIIDELHVWSLTCDEYQSFVKYGKYMRSDYFRKMIENIPVFQELSLDEVQHWEVSLRLKNDSEWSIPVTAGHIAVVDKRTKEPVDTSRLWEPTHLLDYLEADAELHVVDIRFVQGQGKFDGGAFNQVANITYDVLDKGASCLAHTATQFFLGYTTHRNYKDPLGIIRACCDYLLGRLAQFKQDLPSQLDGVLYVSEVMRVEKRHKFLFLFLFADNWTFANLLARYMNVLAPDIAYCASDIDHPDKDLSIVRIHHPDPLKLTADAIDAASKDIATIAKAFATAANK